MIVPICEEPFSEGDGHGDIITVGGWYDTGRGYAGGIEYPAFASEDWCVPGVGSVGVDVEGATGPV